MKNRILSTLGLWLGVFLIVIFFRIQGAVWIIAVAAAISQYELYRMFEKMDLHPDKSLGILTGLLIPLGGYYFGAISQRFTNTEAGTDLFIFGVLLLSLAAVSSSHTKERLKSFMSTLVGLLYIPFMLHFFMRILLDGELHGFSHATTLFLAIWVLAVAKFNDVGALLTGLMFGKNKMAPNMSPGKTWEGAVGGVLTSVLIAVLLIYLDSLFKTNWSPPSLTYLEAAIMAVPIAIAAIVSDLMESAFKRAAGMKDSGNIIPGIGGAFDLTDSLILAGPLAYLMFKVTVF